MNTKSGLVMKIEKNIAYIMTSNGEFIKVKINKNTSSPMIGSEYCGEVLKNTFIKSNIVKYASVACLMLCIILSGGGAYAYYNPVSTVTISINPAIELKSNIWNKVIYANPLNGDGEKILKEISLKNKTVDDALVLVIDQSKKDKFIDENYIKSNKIVDISIKGKELSLPALKSRIINDNLSVNIANNGVTIFNKNSKNENKVSPSNIKNNMNNQEVNSNVSNSNNGNTSSESSDKNNPSTSNNTNDSVRTESTESTKNTENTNSTTTGNNKNTNNNGTNDNSKDKEKNYDDKNDISSKHEHHAKNNHKNSDNSSNHSNNKNKNDE